MNAINITVPFLFNGVHYAGMSIHNGVDFELLDVPCSEPDRAITLEGSICINGETVPVSLSGVIPAVQKKLLSITGAEEGSYPKGVLVNGFSAVNPDEPAHPLYLQIVPAA